MMDANDDPSNVTLFPASFLGCCPDLFCRGSEAEILKLLTRLQCCCKPSWFQSASRPRFRGIFRITVFRSDWAPCTTANSFCAQSPSCKTLKFAEFALKGPALLDYLGTEGRIDLFSKL